jgi:arginyl-tRNA synthetase
MVNLPDGKMKSREGNIIDADNLIKDMIFNSEVYTKKLSKNILFSKNELKDIYNKISIGAIKYFILKVSSNRKILFNPKDSINFQGDTGPFIQYVYARIFSILKKSNIFFLNNNLSINYNLKNLNFIEIKIIEYIYIFYRVLKESSEKYSPFIISKYVLDLSKYYNRLYNKLSILKSESVNTKRFRIYLSYKVSEIIKKSMKILGIDILEKM